VDSFGGVYPQDVKDTIALVRSKTNVKLGFHGHNNLEMALANTLTAIDEGIDIVDATVTGMGRGAGNLKTELLLTVLNAKGLLDFPYNELSKTVDDFTKLQNHYGWGANLPYMVSGANSLPQKQVMEWVGKRYYSFNSIIRALNNQSQGKVDNTKLPELDFGKEKTYAGALIVGGGPSAVSHTKAIDRFLINNPNIIVIHASSKNALSFENVPNDQYFCLVGNEGHRLEDIFQGSNIKGKCILPPYPREMGTYIPKSLTDKAFELESVEFTELYKDSHTALALQSILALKIEKVFITGYDGYSGDHIGEKEQELYLENQYLFSKIRDNFEIQLMSLTPTKYTNLKGDSVYSKI
jgi:4-hydroxy 2-oxovalerate aldolase